MGKQACSGQKINGETGEHEKGWIPREIQPGV